jgi:hypothetical protein
MRRIKAVPITAENFRPYGSFASMLDPEGNCFPGDATFYPDQVALDAHGPVCFSPLTVKKPEKMIVTQAEYHDHTAEGVFVIDDDAVIHVAPPSKRVIVPEKTDLHRAEGHAHPVEHRRLAPGRAAGTRPAAARDDHTARAGLRQRLHRLRLPRGSPGAH